MAARAYGTGAGIRPVIRGRAAPRAQHLLTSRAMGSFVLTSDQLRARTGAKWNNYPSDVTPAFVADMDFAVAPAIQAVMKRFVDAHDYGYGQMSDRAALFEAFTAWMSRRHGW